MSKLDDLPRVVHGYGDYITRSGLQVQVFCVQPDDLPYTFKVKGVLLRKSKSGKKGIREFSVWHVSGRFEPLAESPFDIIGAWV